MLFPFLGCTTVVAFRVVVLGVSSLGHTIPSYLKFSCNLQMMAEDGLTLPSSIRGFVQESNPNPSPNPSPNPVKKKRNLPGTPGKNGFTLPLHMGVLVTVLIGSSDLFFFLKKFLFLF